MSTGSKIEWTDATWNPVVGCTRVSAGCDNCYAVRQSFRNGEMGHAKYKGLTVLNAKGDRHFNGVVRTVEEALKIPLRRKKSTKYFVNSMSDLFHKEVPFDFIDKVFAVMAMTPRHTYQILTKRPERMAEYLNAKIPLTTRENEVASRAAFDGKIVWDPRGSNPENYYGVAGGIGGKDFSNRRAWPGWPLPNVWLCASAENQETFDERIGHLLKCPAAVRGLSLEPLLGMIDLRFGIDAGGDPTAASHYIHWIIVGGESGSGARNCSIHWIQSIVAQCKAAAVPCFVKQLGKHPTFLDYGDTPLLPGQSWHEFRVGPPDYAEIKNPKGGNWDEWPADLRVREFPKLEEVA